MPTTIAISSFQIPDLNFAGSTFKLRRYYDSDWQDVDGVLHLAGTPGSATDSFDEIDCTLVSHTGTVPSFNATPTLTALINQNVRETWQLWDEAGSARNIIAENWFIPASPATITRGALEIENKGQSLLWPPSWYLNALQVQQLIDAQIGLLNHASSVIEGRTFLDVDPLVAITPRAIGSNSPVIPAFVIHTSKYASLNLAITAITALGGGSIVVDSSTALTGNAATTSSIALEFRGQGQITGAFTLTIVGPLDAPVKQIFSSATTISFTGNCSIPVYYSEWFGAKGDNLTASAAGNVTAWNALFAATPAYAYVRVPLAAIYRVNASLTISNKYSGLTIDSGIAKSSGVGATFRWTGSGGVMFSIEGSKYITLRGVTMDLVSGAAIDKFVETGATGSFNSGHQFLGNYLDASLQAYSSFIGIDIDPSGSVNNENMVIEDCNIYCSSGFAQLRGSDDGVMASGSTTLTSATAAFVVGDVGKVIRVGKAGAAGVTLVTTIASRTSATQVTLTDPNASGGNVSLARIHIGTGLGIGIRNGNNANVKHNIVKNCGIQQGNIGIHIISGSMMIDNYGGGYCGTGLKVEGGSETISVHQMVTEGNLVEIDAVNIAGNCYHITDCRGSNSYQLTENFYSLDGSIFIDSSRVEGHPPVGGRIFDLAGSGNLDLTFNGFEFYAGNGTFSIKETGFDTANGRGVRGVNVRGVADWDNGFFSSISGAPNRLSRLVGTSSRPAPRDFAAIAGSSIGTGDAANTGTVYPNPNTLYYGGGALEIGGLHIPNTPTVSVRGAPGAVTRRFRLIARDVLTNRVVSIDPDGGHCVTTICPTTLSATDYLHFDWAAQYPAPTDYVLIEQDPTDVTKARVVATITPSGGNLESYDLVANPAGAYTAAVIPAYNETVTEQFRGALTLSNWSPIAFTPSSPAELVANTNNWNPGGTAPFASSIIRFSTDVSRNITGLTFTKPQTAGQCHLLINIGLANAVLKHQDGASSAANRFFCSTAADITLAPKQAADVIYDDINDYWLVYKRN